MLSVIFLYSHPGLLAIHVHHTVNFKIKVLSRTVTIRYERIIHEIMRDRGETERSILKSIKSNRLDWLQQKEELGTPS